MKIEKYYVVIMLLLSPFDLWSCQPPTPGTPVWDIAAGNVLLTDTIESILGSIDLHFSTTFTAIDQLLALINTIESKASVLLSDLNQLQSHVQVDVATTAVIESKSAQVLHNIPVFDFAGVFTGLDGLQQDIVSQMDLLNTDLTTLSDNLGQLVTTELVHDATVVSQLEQLHHDVIDLQSVLEDIDFTQQFNLSSSIVDLIAADVSILASDIAQLGTQLALGFQSTFSVLDVNLALVDNFNSLVEAIPVLIVDDITGVYTAFSELELTMQTISSQVDAVSADLAEITSAVDLLGSTADQISSQFDTVENSLNLVESILEKLISAERLSLIEVAVATLEKDNSLIDYMLDASLFALSSSISSKLSVVDNEIIGQNSALDIISIDLASIESAVDVVNDVLSRLEVIDSKVDVRLQEVLTIESLVNIIDTDVHSMVDGMQSINSFLDGLLSELPTISSELAQLDEQLFTIHSLVDVIVPMAQIEFSYATNFQSSLDQIALNSAYSGIAYSLFPIIQTTIGSIESKMDIYAPLVPILITQAQELVADMQETWTVLNVIQNSLATSTNTLSSASTLLQTDINKALSISGVFTVIDSIIAQENTLNTKVDTYTSLVAALNANLSTDFSGIFTALNRAFVGTTQLPIIQSALINISSELTTMQNSLGIPIYGSQIPLTITTPGRYYLAENINFSAASGTPITISANNVTLDFAGNFLRYTGGSNLTAININAFSNIRIINGFLIGWTNFAITTLGAATNIILKDLIFIGNAINIQSSTGRNIKIYNCVEVLAGGGMIFTGTNIHMRHCTLIKTGIGPTFGTTNNLVTEDSVIYGLPGVNGALGANGVVTNWIAKNIYTGQGIWPYNANIATMTGCDIINCIFKDVTNFGSTFNGGTRYVIKNNTFTNCISGLAGTMSNSFVGFNTFIQNTSANINIAGANTYLGNFAFNTNAVGSPAPTNYTVTGSSIIGKFITASQRGSFIGVPTYWHNINMLP